MTKPVDVEQIRATLNKPTGKVCKADLIACAVPLLTLVDTQAEKITDWRAIAANRWLLFAKADAELELYRGGYKGGCYACEHVGEKNLAMKAEIKRLRDALENIAMFESEVPAR